MGSSLNHGFYSPGLVCLAVLGLCSTQRCLHVICYCRDAAYGGNSARLRAAASYSLCNKSSAQKHPKIGSALTGLPIEFTIKHCGRNFHFCRFQYLHCGMVMITFCIILLCLKLQDEDAVFAKIDSMYDGQ